MIIPDIDILKSIAYYGQGASLVIGKSLTYFINSIVSIIDTRKSAMRKVKAGSVATGEPRLIWVSFLSKPNYCKVMSLRRKYNKILEESLTMHSNCNILHPIPILKNNYDRFNNLSTNGKIEFWRDIDDQLRQFDKEHDQSKAMVPRKTASAALAKHSKHQSEQLMKCKKLPIPPTGRTPSSSNHHHTHDKTNFGHQLDKELNYSNSVLADHNFTRNYIGLLSAFLYFNTFRVS